MQFCYRWLAQIGGGISASNQLAVAVLPVFCFDCSVTESVVKAGHHQNSDGYHENESLNVNQKLERTLTVQTGSLSVLKVC